MTPDSLKDLDLDTRLGHETNTSNINMPVTCTIYMDSLVQHVVLRLEHGFIVRIHARAQPTSHRPPTLNQGFTRIVTSLLTFMYVLPIRSGDSGLLLYVFFPYS